MTAERIASKQTVSGAQLGTTSDEMEVSGQSDLSDQDLIAIARAALAALFDADEDSDMGIGDSEPDKENEASNLGRFGAIGDHLKRPRTPLSEIPSDHMRESESSNPPNPDYSTKPKISSTIKLRSSREPSPRLTTSEQAEQDAVHMNTLLNSGLIARVFFGEVIPHKIWDRLSGKQMDLLWVVHGASKGEEVNATTNGLIDLSCQRLHVEVESGEEANDSDDGGWRASSSKQGAKNGNSMDSDVPPKRVRFDKDISIREFKRNSQIPIRDACHGNIAERKWKVEDEEQAGLIVNGDEEETVSALIGEQ